MSTKKAPPKDKKNPAAKAGAATASIEKQVAEALAWLKAHSSKATRDGMARYAIPADNALGVSVANIRSLGKRLGRNHDLATALWATGVYEARMLAPFVDEPDRVTPAQMDRWCRDFDNWAICDGVCFHLFDKTPYAFAKVKAWARRRGEFERRAAFALLASLALHDKTSADAPFIAGLASIESAADDDRNFVKKGVSWALRSIGRRNPQLNAQSVALARRLAARAQPTARFIGKEALRELTSAAVTAAMRKIRSPGLRN